MVYPTKSLILKIDVGTLGTKAAGLDGLANSIEHGARTVENTIINLDWSGGSRDAAVERGTSEKIQQLRVANALDSLREAAVAGSTGLQAIIDAVRPAVEDLEQREFAVSEDWTVTDTRDYELDDPDVSEDVINIRKAIQAHRANEANNATTSFRSQAVTFEEIDATAARGITSALEQIGQMAPVVAGLSGGDGATIAKKIEAGMALTPSELQQLQSAGGLSPEQQAALTEGKPATMSQGQYDFLMDMMRELDDKSTSEIDAALSSLPPDQRDVVRGEIGDAIRMAGNPNMTTSAGSKGGMDKLPKEIRELLVDNPIERDVVVSDGYTNPNYIDIPKLGEFKALNSLLSNGDQSLRLGSDVDRGLLKQAAEIAGATEGDASDRYWGAYDSRLEIEDINSTVDAMLNNASGDHQAVSDFLSGENMDVTVTPGNHYDANSHFLDLVTHPWDEDQRGAVNVIDWIGENADAPGHEGELAGRSATTLANLLIDNEDLLSGRIPADDIPGTYTSLGQVNPQLIQSLAVSMSPYLANFVDASDGVLINHHADAIPDTSSLSKLFEVIDSDPVAANVIHTAGAQWQNHLAYEYGQNPDDVTLGNDAGQLDQAMTQGLRDQLSTLRQNEQWDNIVQYNLDQRDYDTAMGVFNAIPLPTGVGEVVGIVNPTIKFETFDIPNDPATLDDSQWQTALMDIDNSALTDSTIRGYSAIEGYAVTHEGVKETFIFRDEVSDEMRSYFLPDGRLDWDEIAARPDGFNIQVAKLGLTFESHYQSGLHDKNITHDQIPRPADPSKPPHPPHVPNP